MQTKHMKLAAVLAAMVSTGAVAQEATEVDTDTGGTVVVPADAATAGGLSPVATAVATDFPILNQDMNDETIAETLLAQGFGDIYILREGSLMTVTATREDQDIELLYNLVEGRLIKVNGERILTEEERALDDDDDSAMVGSDDASDDGADDGTDDGADDGSDDGMDDGTDDGSDDGVDDGTDEGSDDGADDGSDDGMDDGSDDAAEDATDDGSDDASDDGSDSDDSGSDDSGSDDSGSDDSGSDDSGSDDSGSDSDSTSG